MDAELKLFMLKIAYEIAKESASPATPVVKEIVSIYSELNKIISYS